MFESLIFMYAQTHIAFSLCRVAFAGVPQSVEPVLGTLEDSPQLIVIPFLLVFMPYMIASF